MSRDKYPVGMGRESRESGSGESGRTSECKAWEIDGRSCVKGQLVVVNVYAGLVGSDWRVICACSVDSR